MVKEWLTTYKDAIKTLSHDRQESYRQIIEMSNEPQDVDLVKPESRLEPTKARENNIDTDLPVYLKHMLCDEKGNYPAVLNEWEIKVVETEMKRTGFCFWYRNPQQPGQSSLGIAYRTGEQFGIVRPDFVFFAALDNGEVVADLIDPHGLHLADALPKLNGLASYAETHSKAFRLIESVAEVKGKFRALDFTREDVRAAIVSSQDAISLFNGPLANDYE